MPDIGGVAIMTAFAAGIVSFLSPCVLPLVPGYVSYVAGRSIEELQAGDLPRRAALLPSIAFTLGFSLIFIAFGASASALGQLLFSFRAEADLVAGGIVALFGLHLTGVLRVPMLDRYWRPGDGGGGGGMVGAFVLGAAFAFGWTPCIGPILGSILTLGATQSSVAQGIALLAIYSAGLAIPFLLVSVFTGSFLRHSRWLGRAGQRLQFVSGLFLILVGIGMATGVIKSFGTWLLFNVPFLQTLVI